MKSNNVKIRDIEDATGIPYTTIDSILKRKISGKMNLDTAFKLAEFFIVRVANKTSREQRGSFHGLRSCCVSVYFICRISGS